MQSLKFLNGTLNTKNQWLNLPTRNISIYNREFVNRVSFGVIVRCPFVISNYNLKKFRKWLRSRQWILCNFSIFAGVFCRYYPQTDIKHQANDFILFLLCFTINFLHDLILFRNFFLFFCPAFADKLTDIHQRKKWLWQIGPCEFRLWLHFSRQFLPFCVQSPSPSTQDVIYLVTVIFSVVKDHLLGVAGKTRRYVSQIRNPGHKRK